MDDLISRQAAIDALHNYWRKRLDTLPTKKTEDGEVYADTKSVNKILEYNKALTNFIKALPSAQQWIPCSERLPDQNGKYLVVGRQKAINILKFDGGRWYGKWGVVAWMPLPKPYEGENNEMDAS